MRKKTDSLQKKIASFMLGMHYLTGTNSCIQLALIEAMATIRAIYGIGKIYEIANIEYYLLLTDDLTDIYYISKWIITIVPSIGSTFFLSLYFYF